MRNVKANCTRMFRLAAVLLCTMALFACTSKEKQQINAAKALIERVTPGYSEQFNFKIIPSEGNDVYGWKSSGGKVELQGNNTISLAVAYYNYLKEYCKVNMGWCGDQMNLPDSLPLPAEEFNGTINAKWRVYLNYCSFSYSAAWWDWERWQRELDFMAMNGINMPLSVVGSEAVWYYTMRDFKYSETGALSFLSGPGFWPWQLMTNITGYFSLTDVKYIKIASLKRGEKQGVAQFGRARNLGFRGCTFKSCHPEYQ